MQHKPRQTQNFMLFRLTGWLTTALLIVILAQTAQTQPRYTYQMLANQNRESNVHFDFIYQPGPDGKTEIIILHRVQYPYLTFRRQVIQGRDQNTTQFAADISITFDFYDGESDPIPTEPFIAREMWNSSVTVQKYEDTQNPDLYLSGITKITLPPDTYHLIPTVSINGREVTGARAANIQQGRQPAQPVGTPRGRRAAREAREAAQRRGIVNVPDLSTNQFARLTLISNTEEDLIARNFGRSVTYADDFGLLVSYPAALERDSIEVRVYQTGLTPTQSNSGGSQVWGAFLHPSYNQSEGKLIFQKASGSQRIIIDTDDSESMLHQHLTVPNHKLANAWFRADVFKWKGGESTKVGESTWQSRWFNMPTSLLNLDVAIDMLRFIVEDSQLREMRRGSMEEKEARFRAFWRERDPTPETDFNELMAEYYRRIDHAFQEFSTPSRPGFESDQGRTYIVYGPPDSVERRLPAGGSATEVWTYGSQTFIFRATTGFGDFQLVTPSN